MAIITDLTMQKNKSRANIYLDNEFACGMDLATIVKNGIKKGVEISKERLNELKIESENEKAYEKALSLVDRQKYTVFQLKTKLSSKGFSHEAIQFAIDKLKHYGFLDDKDFAESFVRASSKKSKKELENALYQKGISGEIIESVLVEMEVDEEEVVRALIEKFMRYKEPSKENNKKLLAYLYRKGFNLSLCERIIKDYNFSDFED